MYTNLTSPLTLSRPNTCLGRLFPCVHGPFSMGVGISLPWFQNTIISGKHTHVAKCARPPISQFLFYFTEEHDKYTYLGSLARLQRYIFTCALRMYHHVCSIVENCDDRCMLGTRSRCRLFVCVYGVQVWTYRCDTYMYHLLLLGPDTDTSCRVKAASA